MPLIQIARKSVWGGPCRLWRPVIFWICAKVDFAAKADSVPYHLVHPTFNKQHSKRASGDGPKMSGQPSFNIHLHLVQVAESDLRLCP